MSNFLDPSLPLILLFGLGWGSFATMAIYRLPRGMTWIGRKPFCPLCKHPLGFLDYCQIFSWLFWRGRCRYCKGRIAHQSRYVITELLTLIWFVASYLRFGWGEIFCVVSLIGVGATILFVITLDYEKLPEKILPTLFLLAAVYRVRIEGEIFPMAMGAIILGVVALVLRHAYFWFVQKDPNYGKDYCLERDQNHFDGPGFDLVKLAIIIGASLPTTTALSLILINVLLALMLYTRFPRADRTTLQTSLLLWGVSILWV